MKLDNILLDSLLEEDTLVAEDAVSVIEELQDMLDDIKDIKHLLDEGVLTEDESTMVTALLSDMDNILSNTTDIEELAETVDRQFRRYGDKFLRQYRCTSGPKAGRLVTSPASCGKRKDPRRVRIGKRASRVKKGIRIRKSLFTKRKTASKRLSRLNTVLRGDKSKKKTSTDDPNKSTSKSKSTTNKSTSTAGTK